MSGDLRLVERGIAADDRDSTADARDSTADDRDEQADERERNADARDASADHAAVISIGQRRTLADARENGRAERDTSALERSAATIRRLDAFVLRRDAEQLARAADATRSVAAHRVLNSAAAVSGGIGLLQLGLGDSPDPDTAALLRRMDVHAHIVSNCLRELVGGQSATTA